MTLQAENYYSLKVNLLMITLGLKG